MARVRPPVLATLRGSLKLRPDSELNISNEAIQANGGTSLALDAGFRSGFRTGFEQGSAKTLQDPKTTRPVHGHDDDRGPGRDHGRGGSV